MLKKLGHAEFTIDMVQTLSDYFEAYEVDGVVTVEITNAGLWLPNPHFTSRQFLGLARWPNSTAN